MFASECASSACSDAPVVMFRPRLTLQVDTVIEGCCFFLERSAYHAIQPVQLSAHLQAAGMVQSHARAFSGVWEAEASSVFLPVPGCRSPLATA
jgi:hypothetical protein